MKLVVLTAVAALAVGVLASGCAARSASRDPAPEAPSHSPTASASSPAPSASPRRARVRTTDVGATGLNVRYLQDGKAKNLDVKDFPR